MKYIYLISWCIIARTIIPCQTSNQYTDEFGRNHNNFTANLSLCYKQDTSCNYSKIFIDRNDAVNFYNKAKIEQKNHGIIDAIYKVQIDSIEIK